MMTAVDYLEKRIRDLVTECGGFLSNDTEQRIFELALTVVEHPNSAVESDSQTPSDPGQSVPALRQAIDILARACEAGAYVGSRSAAVLQARVLVPKTS